MNSEIRVTKHSDLSLRFVIRVSDRIEVAMQEIEHPYPQVDMTKVGRIIRQLHDQVVGQRKRVEITRAGSDDTCVMISRAELETLEQALAIFADTEEFNEMCKSLKNLLNTAGVVYAPQAIGDAIGTNRFAENRD